MPRTLIVLAGLVLVVGGLFGYRAYQAKASAPARAEGQTLDQQTIINELRKQSVMEGVSAMQQYVGPEGRGMLKGLVDKFPRTDAGIAYAGLAERREGASLVFAPQVMYVYRGSGAEKAGILPGDVVVTINGTSVEITCAEDERGCPSKDAIAKVQSAIAVTDGKSSGFFVRRPGTDGVYTVFPVPYGKEIHDFTAQRLDGYNKYLDQMAPRVAEFAKKAEAADAAKADALMAEAKELYALVSVPFKEVDDFFETRIILAPKPTRAEPQL